jgi:hypothetical protein
MVLERIDDSRSFFQSFANVDDHIMVALWQVDLFLSLFLGVGKPFQFKKWDQ